MNANDIPVAHTPAGGYGATFPPLILAGCDEPLVEGAPDLRGTWKTISATRGGEPVPADDRLMSYTERIEQCGNRIVDCGGGTIADARADLWELLADDARCHEFRADRAGLRLHRGIAAQGGKASDADSH